MATDNYVHHLASAGPGKPLLFLFHGTGGDERQLLQLGAELAPGAGIVSPRGALLATEARAERSPGHQTGAERSSCGASNAKLRAGAATASPLNRFCKERGNPDLLMSLSVTSHPAARRVSSRPVRVLCICVV